MIPHTTVKKILSANRKYLRELVEKAALQQEADEAEAEEQ